MLFGFQDDGQFRAGNMAPLHAGRAMGGRAVRIIIDPGTISRPNGAYDFSLYDNIVNQARQQGIHPQIVLDNRGGFKGHGMGDPKKYEQFVKAAGVHFKGRVGRYSFVNEPDLKMGADKYRQLYVRGQRMLAKVDPSAQILFGEFSPHNPVGYAKQVLAKGNLRTTGIALHPYQFTSDPLAPQQGDLGGIGRLGTLTKQFGRLGLKTPMGRRPGLYLTEFGYRTDALSQQQAAQWWPRALRKARSAGAREMIAYSMTAGPQGGWDSGLLNADGSPRPAYQAIKASSRYTR